MTPTNTPTNPQSFLSVEMEKWFEEKNRFALPQKVWHMLRTHGRLPGKNCRTCRFIERQGYHNKAYYKCLKYRVTRGEQTDWRLKYPACGLHEPITEKRETTPQGE